MFEGHRPERQKPRARCESALLRQQENSVRNFTGRRGPVAVILPSVYAWFFLLSIKTESRQTGPAGRRYTLHRLTLFLGRLFRPLNLLSSATPPPSAQQHHPPGQMFRARLHRPFSRILAYPHRPNTQAQNGIILLS